MLKIKIYNLSGKIIYERGGYFYGTFFSAIFKIKNEKASNKYKKRLEIGESMYFKEMGNLFLEGFAKGLRND